MTPPIKKKTTAKPRALKHVVHHHAPHVHVPHVETDKKHRLAGAIELGIYNPHPVTAVAGETFVLRLRANKGGRLEWHAKGLPEGLIINRLNGEISGTPALPGTSEVTIDLSWTDGNNSDKAQIDFPIECT